MFGPVMKLKRMFVVIDIILRRYPSHLLEGWFRLKADLCVFMVIICICGYTRGTYADEYKTDPRAVCEWAETIAPSHKGLLQFLLGLKGKYEILFIPGIMGSKIHTEGYVWGEGSADAEKLVITEGIVAEPEVMNEFTVTSWSKFAKADIYGSGLDELNRVLGGKEVKVFAYDWRQDLRCVAERFDEYANTDLKGKKVVVVAHSMGGLMFWYWKNTRKAQRPFKLLTLVLLGSPIQGSCEVARMLIGGYSPYEGASRFDKAAYHLLFDKMQAAAFTFPSVFQLLPRAGN
jgi:hypothetical protein